MRLALAPKVAAVVEEDTAGAKEDKVVAKEDTAMAEGDEGAADEDQRDAMASNHRHSTYILWLLKFRLTVLRSERILRRR